MKAFSVLVQACLKPIYTSSSVLHAIRESSVDRIVLTANDRRTGLHLPPHARGRDLEPHFQGRQDRESVIRALEVVDNHTDRTQVNL